MVKSGAAAFESRLLSMEMHPSTAAAGIVPTGEASKASETTSKQPPLRFCSTEETDLEAKNSWTSILSASYDSSSVLQERNLSATPYCRRVVNTKSRQNSHFDPGDSQGPLRACPLLGSWRALVCGEVLRTGAAGDELQRFSNEIRWLFEQSPFLMPRQDIVSPSRAARGYRNSREDQRSRRHGDSRRLEVRGERLSRSVMER